ncbi:Heat shock protein [Venturia inaequalis]|nr:Heat shock protein [Venturia inaequalis]
MPVLTESSDLLQRHHILVHKEAEEQCSDQEGKIVQRRPIACVACARAKTKCDKLLPSCSRCISKGLLCEARSTKRSNDAAYRLAKRQLSLYRRPIPIAPSDGKSTTPPALDFTVPRQYFTSSPAQPNLQDQNVWSEEITTSSIYQSYPPAPPTTPSMCGSDSKNRAPTPLILDGSEFESPYASGGQIHSSDFFSPTFDQYSGIPLSYSPEPMFPASLEAKEDVNFFPRHNNEQTYGTGGFTSYPSVQVTNPQNMSHPPDYQWTNFMTPQYHSFTMPPSRPSSAASSSSRYGTSF